MNRYYQKRGKEISEGFEAREAERYFRQAKDLQGPLKHTVQKPLCTELEFVQHFSSHFKDRQLPLPSELNSAKPFLPPTLAAPPEINDSPPSLEEIRTIVEKFKLRKAAGSDDLVNELLRYSNDCPDFIKILHELVTVIWESEDIPDQWRRATISTLHKKRQSHFQAISAHSVSSQHYREQSPNYAAKV